VSIGACASTQNSTTVIVTVSKCIARETTPVETVSEIVPFGVVAYPNPFSESFTLNVSTSSKERIQIFVYDMIGKMVGQLEVSPTDKTTIEIGDHFSSGVYNVIVNQGENAKTIRLVKR
jgi:hypothetical protein